MSSVKVDFVDGKVRLFIDGEEVTWEVSLVNNKNSAATILDKTKSDKKSQSVENVASNKVASDENIVVKNKDVNNTENTQGAKELTEKNYFNQKHENNKNLNDLSCDETPKNEEFHRQSIPKNLKILNVVEELPVQNINLNKEKYEVYVNENINPVKQDNFKNVPYGGTNKPVEKPIETQKKGASNSKTRQKKRKQNGYAEPKVAEIVYPSYPNEHGQAHIKQPRAYIQSIIKALSGERKVEDGSLIYLDQPEVVPVKNPQVIKIEKIAYMPTLNKKMAVALLSTNLNETNAFIENVLDVLGVPKCLELYEKTRIVQEHGGLDVKNGSRKRTPGGVFITLMREDKTIREEDIEKILKLSSANGKKLDTKVRHAKANAEIKEQLEQGGYL